MLKKTIILILFVVAVKYASSQIRYGLPNYKFFTVDDYKLHPQVWSISQLGDGRIIIGTHNGISLYDGNRFETILLGYSARTLFVDTIDGKERIFFGGDGNFGYIEKDSIGNFIETFLSDSLQGNNKNFVAALDIKKKGEAVYFSCLKKLFIYKNDTLFKVLDALGDNIFLGLYKIYNRFFLYNNLRGILEIKDDSLVELPNTDFLAYRGIDYIIPAGDNKLYIAAARPYQIFLYDLSDEKNIKLIHSSLEQFFLEKGFTTLTPMKDGNFVVGTSKGGIVVTHKDFSPIFVMNSTNSLENNYISITYVDNQNNIWFGSNNGFGVIFYNNKVFKVKNRKIGIENFPTKVATFNDSLFIGNFGGLSKLKLDTFPTEDNFHIGINTNIEKEFSGQVMDFLRFNEDDIILSGRFGVYELKGHHSIPIDTSFMGYRLLLSKYDSSLIYLTTIEGVVVLKKRNDLWYSIMKIKLQSDLSGAVIYETSPYNIYTLLDNGLIENIHFDFTFMKYTISEINLNNYDFGFRSNLYLLDDTLFLLSLKNDQAKVFYLDKSKDTLLRWHYNVIFDDNSNLTSIPGASNNLFLEKDTFYVLKTGYSFTRMHLKNNTIHIGNKDFRSLQTKGVFDAYYDKKRELVWCVTVDELYNFPFSYQHLSQPFNCLITSVQTKNDSLLASNNINPTTILSFNYNTLIFNFTSPYFERSEDIKYSYYLEGFDKEWSEWNKRNFTKYTNLPSGTYIFKVKGKNVYGEESREATFRFTILPPWYMTWWAYVLYVLFGVVFIVIIVRLYSYRLKRANERLEKIVRERNKELYHKNELITHSIEYAKKIQDAILPVEGEFKKEFADAFVFFRPKDIVSGDFYWFYKISNDEVIVALSDCTGHGVPGAFMSMIGISLLNEIVMDQKIYEPSKILLELHGRVKKSLQSKKELTDTFDGMDIAVLRINFKEKQILLSSANQYAFVVKGDDVDAFLGDIYSIGDPLAREEIGFITKSIDFDEKTVVYLTSDGFLDQFGGDTGGKYSVGRFVELLKQIKDKDFDKQRERLIKEFEEWKSGYAQLDDVLVIGFKIEPRS